MTMNVYLAFSMTLAAAVEGIKMKIHPGKLLIKIFMK